MCTNCKDCRNCNKMWGGCSISKIMKALVIVGALNWGFIGIGMLSNSPLNFNLVKYMFGVMPEFEAVIYLLVGLSAFSLLFGCKCKKCKNSQACAECKVN